MKKLEELLQDIQDMCPDYYNRNYNYLHNIKESLIKEKDEFAIGFAEWINKVSYRSFDGNWYLTQIEEDIKKTTEELLEIYKKEKGL